jgi:hypothetical protein
MKTLACLNKDCLLRIRLERVIDKPIISIQKLGFCPGCGGKALQLDELNEDYWEQLAKSYELPVFLLRQLYDNWDHNEYPNFRDFVNAMKQESGIAV